MNENILKSEIDEFTGNYEDIGIFFSLQYPPNQGGILGKAKALIDGLNVPQSEKDFLLEFIEAHICTVMSSYIQQPFEYRDYLYTQFRKIEYKGKIMKILYDIYTLQKFQESITLLNRRLGKTGKDISEVLKNSGHRIGLNARTDLYKFVGYKENYEVLRLGNRVKDRIRKICGKRK